MGDNPLCPDHSSHWENAADLAFPAGVPERLTSDQFDEIDAVAEVEYQSCEGHQ